MLDLNTMTAVIGLILGGISLCFGYRIFNVVITLCGALVFGVIGNVLAVSAYKSGLLHGLIVLGCAIAGALLARYVYLLGLLIFGAVLGSSWIPLVSVYFPWISPLVLLLIGAVAGVLLIKLLERPVIILFTVMVGAGSIISWGKLLLGATSIALKVDSANAVISDLYMTVIWAVLVAVGLLSQFKWTGINDTQ